MKALEEVGFKTIIKFAIYSFVQVIYHQLINHLFFLPPARKVFLILLGAKIGSDSILMDVKFFNWHHMGPRGLEVGRKCFLGDETLIDLYDSVILEDNVTLGQRVLILTHTNVGYHDHPLQKYFPKKSKKVVLKNGCFIGAGTIILPGIVVSENAFIGAGSVVTTDVPPNSVFAGVPAKLVRKLT